MKAVAMRNIMEGEPITISCNKPLSLSFPTLHNPLDPPQKRPPLTR